VRIGHDPGWGITNLTGAPSEPQHPRTAVQRAGSIADHSPVLTTFVPFDSVHFPFGRLLPSCNRTALNECSVATRSLKETSRVLSSY
jgi:hypothetical protein